VTEARRGEARQGGVVRIPGELGTELTDTGRSARRGNSQVSGLGLRWRGMRLGFTLPASRDSQSSNGYSFSHRTTVTGKFEHATDSGAAVSRMMSAGHSEYRIVSITAILMPLAQASQKFLDRDFQPISPAPSFAQRRSSNVG
jgi:hypothetical protein